MVIVTEIKTQWFSMLLAMQYPACVYLFSLLSLLLVTTCTQAVTVNNNLTCPDILAQRSLDLEQIMGSWYVVESVQHNVVALGREGQLGNPKGHLTCAVFHLELLNATTVLLEWEQQQPYPVLEYTLTISDVTSLGSWSAQMTPWSWQDGTPREQVHVMKAVGDHAALTFCQPGAGGHVFTAVLGRRNHLTPSQIRGVNAMLQRRGLDVIQTRLMDEELCYKQKVWSQGAGAGGGPGGKAAASRPVVAHMHRLMTTIFILLIFFM